MGLKRKISEILYDNDQFSHCLIAQFDSPTSIYKLKEEDETYIKGLINFLLYNKSKSKDSTFDEISDNLACNISYQIIRYILDFLNYVSETLKQELDCKKRKRDDDSGELVEDEFIRNRVNHFVSNFDKTQPFLKPIIHSDSIAIELCNFLYNPKQKISFIFQIIDKVSKYFYLPKYYNKTLLELSLLSNADMLEKNFEVLAKFCQNNKLDSSLTKLIKYGKESNVRLMLEKFDSNKKQIKRFLFWHDDKGESAITLSIIGKNIEILNLLIDCFDNSINDDHSFLSLIVSNNISYEVNGDEKEIDILQLCAESDNYQALEVIITKLNLLKCSIGSLDYKDPIKPKIQRVNSFIIELCDEESLLMTIAKKGEEEIFDKMMKFIENVDVKEYLLKENSDNETLLEYALIGGSLKIINHIIGLYGEELKGNLSNDVERIIRNMGQDQYEFSEEVVKLINELPTMLQHGELHPVGVLQSGYLGSDPNFPTNFPNRSY